GLLLYNLVSANLVGAAFASLFVRPCGDTIPIGGEASGGLDTFGSPSASACGRAFPDNLLLVLREACHLGQHQPAGRVVLEVHPVGEDQASARVGDPLLDKADNIHIPARAV